MSVKGSRRGLKKYMDGEDGVIALMEEEEALQELYDNLKPILRELVKHGDVKGILKTYSSAAILEMIDLMRNAKSESVRRAAAKDFAYMAGLNPTAKSINVAANISNLTTNQRDALLASKLANLPKEKLDLIYDALSRKRNA